MNREAKALLLLAAIVLAFALGGCSSDGGSDEGSEGVLTSGSTIDTPITDEEIGAQAVILTVHESPGDYPYFSMKSDAYIEQVARLVCNGFADGVNFLEAVNAVSEGAGTDPMEAAHFVGASVGGMCAEYASVVGQY